MLPPEHPWYRHPDGTFQIDRYRENARAMRRQALQQTPRARSLIKFLIALGALFAATALIAPKHADHGMVSAGRSSAPVVSDRDAPPRPSF
jgi:hypothetical protein